MKFFKYILIYLLMTASIAIPANGAPGDYPHPELKWYSIESEHFFAYYHEGAERTAETVLKIAEEIYQPVTQVYGYEPDGKIRFVIMDTDDYSNGGAYYYDNKILIWATALDWDLRGMHNWLRNVVSHEFSHMVQLGASRKIARQIPAVYLQWLNYEDEKRPDVLYGFPNVLMSYPIAMTVIPPWFAEGCAQVQAPGFGYDSRDSHREMILRTRVLCGSLLTLDEMSVFNKNTIGNESVYNQGFSLVDYIIRNYGEESLERVSGNMKEFSNYSFDKACKNALGIGEYQLYSAWKDSLERFYHRATANIVEHQVAGELIATPGFGNFYPVSLSDSEFVYLSNDDNDYMSLTNIYKYNLNTKENKPLKRGVHSRPTLSPNKKWLAYSRIQGLVKRSSYDDLFLLDLEQNEEYRLTKGARASAPVFSPDGKSLVFVLNKGGTKNLAIAPLPDLTQDNLKLDNWQLLTNFKDGELVNTPIFTNDGAKLIFAYAYDSAWDLMIMDLTTKEISPLRNSIFDERNPSLSPDGDKLLYSCDKTGIFNLYLLDLKTGEESLLTNVLGGAFMGNFAQEGEILYAGYENNGFRIFHLTRSENIPPEYAVYIPEYQDHIPSASYNDRQLPEYKPEKYQPVFGKLFFLPRLTYDLRSFKPGLYVYSNDFLNWFNLFGGFSFNGLTEEPRFFQGLTHINPRYLGDYDLVGIVEYSNIIPNIFIEGYHIMRRSHQIFEDEFHIIGETPEGLPIYDDYAIDYRFSLNEVDAGFRYRYNDNNIFELRGIASRYGAKLNFDDGGNFAYTYFKGKSLALRWQADHTRPGVDQDINPSNGRRFIAEVARENNAFIDSFKVDAGMIEEVFSPYNYNRLSLIWEEYRKSPLNKEHTLNLRFTSALIDRNDTDDFFYLYAGGLPGLKGYSYYSLGGTRKFVGNLTYRFPLFKNFNRTFLHAYIHNVYLAGFCDYGNAWVGEVDFRNWKKDVGLNLRAKLTSFFTFPTAITLEAAYGLDKFQVNQTDFSGTYGQEWRYYLTILFDFNMMLGDKKFPL